MQEGASKKENIFFSPEDPCAKKGNFPNQSCSGDVLDVSTINPTLSVEVWILRDIHIVHKFKRFPSTPQGPCFLVTVHLSLSELGSKWPGHTMEPMPSFHPMITVMVSSSCVTFFDAGWFHRVQRGCVTCGAFKAFVGWCTYTKTPVNLPRWWRFFFWSQTWPFSTGKFGSAECWSTWAYHVETYYVSGSITTTLLCIKM